MTSHQFGTIRNARVINLQSNVWVEDNINNKNNDRLSIKLNDGMSACHHKLNWYKINISNSNNKS